MHKPVLDEGRTQRTNPNREVSGAAAQHSQRVPRSRSSARGELPSWRPSVRLEPVESYGRFEILGRIGRGGMAEILLARERSLTGGVRHLVIKRVLPEARDLDDMVHMFLDETRIVMGLSHPNLCQIFEVGEQDGAWFIAMEWVNGVTLQQLARRAREESRVDYAVLARVIAQCAEALHYAHTARDAEGQPMNLVHRDVSPHNLMVAYDGRVKLLDFGIAKSTATTHHTEAGVVKGKISYMAPEQWLTQPADARTDVFTLGICLYEALAGRVLFKRDTQLEVMRSVTGGDVPLLSQVAQEAPRALAEIAHRALETKPELRYQSAREMAEALERFLASTAEPVSAARIASYTRELFAEEVELGPVLERAGRGAQFSRSDELLLPPLPPSLLGVGRRPGSVRPLPPPPFVFTAPALSLPSDEDPRWADLDGFEPVPRTERTELKPISVAPASEERAVAFSEPPSGPMPLAAPEIGESPRPLAPTLSMRVGPRARRAVLAAMVVLAALPLAWSMRSNVTPKPRTVATRAVEAPMRTGSSSLPAFTLLPPSAPLTAQPELATRARPADREPPPRAGTLSINTRPWSTVYLGSRLLGSTPLAEVAVPRTTLMLKLVDRDGRVHLRRIPVSSQKGRTAFFQF